VRAGHLSADEIAFWQETYTLGLAEHFMVNQIESLDGRAGGTLTVDIRVESPRGTAAPAAEPPTTPPTTEPTSAEESMPPERVLVPLGGGKDSATVLMLLRRAGVKQIVPFFPRRPCGGV